MGAPPRLIDLSVARTLEEAAVVRSPIGTDAYMAPEQRGPTAGSGRRRTSGAWPRRCARRADGDDLARAIRCRAGDRRARLAAAPHAAALAAIVRAGLDPTRPPGRPRAEFAAALEPLVAALPAPADARPPLVTLCGGWPAATPSPPARCSAPSSSSRCTCGAASSTGTTARACTPTRRGCSCDGGDLYGHIVVAQPPWQFLFGAGALAIHDSLTFLRLAVGIAQLGAGRAGRDRRLAADGEPVGDRDRARAQPADAVDAARARRADAGAAGAAGAARRGAARRAAEDRGVRRARWPPSRRSSSGRTRWR